MDFVQPNAYPPFDGPTCPTCKRRLWRARAITCSECCSHPARELEATRARNGVLQYRRRCTDCGLAHGIKHSEIAFDESAVITADYTDSLHPCARCGDRLTEYHHFAPSAIFGGYESLCWPGAWLCRECHSIWHRQMRMAGGYKLEPSRRLREASYTTPEQWDRDVWREPGMTPPLAG